MGFQKMAEVPPLYKDVGKKARDLLSKNFPDSMNLEVNNKQPLEVKFSTFQRSKGASSFELEASQNFITPYLNLPTKVTVFTDSLEKFHFEEQVENFLLDGSKHTYRLTSKGGAFENKFTTEYKRPLLAVTTGVNAAGGKTSANASAAVGKKEGFIGGAEADLSVDARQLTTSSLGASYVLKDFEVSGFIKNGKTRNYVLSVWSILPQINATFAAEVAYDGTQTSARAGLEKKLFPDVTGKIRWDNKNVVGLSFVTKINNSTELTFAEEIDFDNAKVSKVGFLLAFK